jgi:hypothetical protein
LSVNLLLAFTFMFIGVVLFFEGYFWLGIISLILWLFMMTNRYDLRRKQTGRKRKETNTAYYDSAGFYGGGHDHGRDCHDIGGGDSGGSCD